MVDGKGGSEALIFSIILCWANYFGELTLLSYASFDMACSVTLLQSTSKSVPMMTQCHSFSFTFLEDLQAQILRIPYKNSDLSMFVLLPNDIDGLEKVKPCISPILLSFPEALRPTGCFRVSLETELLIWSRCLIVPSRKYFSFCAAAIDGCLKKSIRWMVSGLLKTSNTKIFGDELI